MQILYKDMKNTSHIPKERLHALKRGTLAAAIFFKLLKNRYYFFFSSSFSVRYIIKGSLNQTKSFVKEIVSWSINTIPLMTLDKERKKR